MSREPATSDLWLYWVLACALSWAWWVPMALAGATSQPGQGWPTHLPGLLGPALAAVIVTARRSGTAGLADLGRRVVRWRLGWRWWALLGVTALLVLIPLPVAAVRGEPLPGIGEMLAYSGAPVPSGVLPAVLLLAAIWLVNGVGEELGWRGYLSDHLCRRHSRGVAALIVWVAWAVWHVPLFWVVGSFLEMSPAMIVGWAVGLLAGSFVLTWMHQAADRSVFLVATWHVLFNLATATEAGAGLAAAVTSTVVMAGAVWLGVRRSTWAGPASSETPPRQVAGA